MEKPVPAGAAATDKVVDYRYDRAKRKNNPPAGLAAQGRVAERPAEHYFYDPHLPPVLRFDSTGQSDRLFDVVAKARHQTLSEEETNLLADALRSHEPWLEWSGKREQQRRGFAVDPVALHIHERVAAQAIVKVAARQDVQRSLFADPQQDYREAIQFYQHDVDWANRLILGDSLQVMSSLAEREGLAGQVQMIYMDPPYGIKFASNFQPLVTQRDVKDRPDDLSRDPETIRAYRDTWRLGVHSYLAYLRDRLVVAKELLSETGSIFVQIGDENVQRIRALMDDVFGSENFISSIAFKKTGFQASHLLPSNYDHICWYAKDAQLVKFKQIHIPKLESSAFVGQDLWIEENGSGTRRRLTSEESANILQAEQAGRVFRHKLAESSGATSTTQPFLFQGRTFLPKNGKHWSTTAKGMERLEEAGRFILLGNSLRYVNYLNDFSVSPLTSVWTDTVVSGFSDPQLYVVQTSAKVVQRCLLMTTDPGDLVLDPTCGSGTAAYVAEQWGRRWITIDTSRVALALTRQRLLVSTYDYYKLRDSSLGIGGGFCNRTISHIMLKGIAQNVALDPVIAKHNQILIERLSSLNTVLLRIPADVRTSLATKLATKERAEGTRAITDADRRRWLLPKEHWEEWQVPFDTDSDWPQDLQDALVAYRAAWRAKMDEVNAIIAASVEREELVDQPEVVKGVVRVSGPFTVEAVLPPEESLDLDAAPVDPFDADLDTFGDSAFNNQIDVREEPKNAEAYLDNKQVRFARLDPLREDVLHAEGEWLLDGDSPRRVAVSFGPQYGNVTAKQVEDGLRSASRRGYDDLIFAGFGFDATAQAVIQEDPNPHVRAHLAQIRPDVTMGDLLKQTPNSQIFTILGLPRTRLDQTRDNRWTVTMEGVDVYDPVSNTLSSTGADKVAAWFIDSDYDGRTFCITQAFFPDKSAWDKLARALNGVKAVDTDAFAAFSGTVSLPFPTGDHARVAVKVIDPRGNEVMHIHALTPEAVYA